MDNPDGSMATIRCMLDKGYNAEVHKKGGHHANRSLAGFCLPKFGGW